MKSLTLTLLTGLLLASASVFSQSSEEESAVKVKFLIDAGFEYGGDEILQVFFTNGDDQIMRAGQGAYLAIGGQIEFEKVKNLMFRASIGIKFNTTAADNANIRLTRFPINIMPYWKIKDDFRLGVGITSHQGIKFKGDGYVDDIDYTSKLGPRFEIGYKWIAATYTLVAYKADTSETVSASSLGLSFSFTIPNK